MLLAPPTASGATPTLDATRKSRKAARSRGASLSLLLLLLLLLLRLQRVDGRRFDAFVADLHCSRVHGGAAPIVSYVSALPRPSASVRVCIVCFVSSCLCGRACGRARVRACVCMRLGI